MCCFDCIVKYILFILNFVVFCCGAVLLGVGIALVIDDSVIQWITDITGGGSMNDDLFRAAVYTMITVGSLLFIVGFFGCCGACKENVCMLQTYAVLVCILLLLEIVGGILAAVFINEIGEEVESSMTESVFYKYSVEETTTTAWDSMQIDLKCCGSIDYNDYLNSTYYNNTGNIVPESCCSAAKLVEGKPSIDPDEFESCKNATASGVNKDNVLYEEGCYTKFEDWVEENSKIIMGVFFSLAGVQLICLIAACCLRDSYGDKGYTI